jgi:myosin heavy subunit
VEENILLANPILEAFGNAKTLRNNNSSRFGKWVEIHFDKQGHICGAKTQNYLLEKSRVVSQTQGERNYHIFYQLCSGASDKLRKQFSIGKPEDYKYLNQSGCIAIEGTDDKADFQEVEDAMKKIKFSDTERESVFQIITAVLHLGNINYKPVTIKYNNADVQAADVENHAVLEKAATLLSVKAADLKKAICFRRMTIKGQAPTDIPLDDVKARDNCNALAKTIYGALFDWLVKRINMSMAPPANSPTLIIGVLDIFGFEIFEVSAPSPLLDLLLFYFSFFLGFLFLSQANLFLDQ